MRGRFHARGAHLEAGEVIDERVRLAVGDELVKVGLKLAPVKNLAELVPIGKFLSRQGSHTLS
jgi:hypothetical protein